MTKGFEAAAIGLSQGETKTAVIEPDQASEEANPTLTEENNQAESPENLELYKRG